MTDDQISQNQGLGSDDTGGGTEGATQGVDPDMTADEKADTGLEEQLPRNPSADEGAPGIP